VSDIQYADGQCDRPIPRLRSVTNQRA